MEKYTAIVLGGTEDHIHLIRRLKKRGYKVVLCDYLEDPPAGSCADLHVRDSILDYDAVAATARKYEAGLIISACIDQAIPVMTELSAQRGTPCYLSLEQGRAFTDKQMMKERMLAAGIPTARYSIIDKHQVKYLHDFSYPLIVKPTDTNSSKGVVKVNNKAELQGAIHTAARYSRNGKLVVEEFMPGKEYSIDIILVDGQPIILGHSSLEKSGILKDRFAISKCTMPGGLNEAILISIKDNAEKISRIYNYPNGPLLMQVIADHDRIRVIEFSGRIGGGSKHHLIRLSCRFDCLGYILGLHERVTADIETIQDGHYYSCCYAYARNGTIRQYSGLDACKKSGDLLDYYLYKREGSSITGMDSSSHRPFSYIVRGASLEEVDHKIVRIDAQLRIWSETGEDLLVHGLHESASKFVT